MDMLTWPPPSRRDDSIIPDYFRRKEARIDYFYTKLLNMVEVTGPISCGSGADPLSSEKIHWLRENVDRMRSEPTFALRNGSLMQRIACIIQAFVSQAPPTTTRVASIANGGIGVVFRGELAGKLGPTFFPSHESPLFLTKASLTVGEDLETRNEAIVGLYGLNSLRDECPHFMYVYGAYECGGIRYNKKKKRVSTCAPGTENTLYTMIETISDAQTLGKFLDRAGARHDVRIPRDGGRP